MFLSFLPPSCIVVPIRELANTFHYFKTSKQLSRTILKNDFTT